MYTVGSRKMIKNWEGMAKIAASYGDDIAGMRDTFADSSLALSAEWPGVHCHEIIRTFLVTSGVLFADAGKSKHPHARSKVTQKNISDYAQRMVSLWLRVRTTISNEELQPRLGCQSGVDD